MAGRPLECAGRRSLVCAPPPEPGTASGRPTRPLPCPYAYGLAMIIHGLSLGIGSRGHRRLPLYPGLSRQRTTNGDQTRDDELDRPHPM
jgi:hypothetical protein